MSKLTHELKLNEGVATLSGDNNLSGNLIIGDNNVSFLDKSFMYGQSLTVGTNSFQIRYIDTTKKRLYVNSNIPDDMMLSCLNISFNGKLKANLGVGKVIDYGLDNDGLVEGYKKYFVVDNLNRTYPFNGTYVDNKTFLNENGTPYTLNVHEGHYYDTTTGKTYIVITKKDAGSDYSSYEPIEINTLTEVDYSRQNPTNYKINSPTNVLLGDGTRQGYNALSFGENSKAISRSSIALGRDCSATKDYGMATGRNNTAGYAAFSAGQNNNATGNYSTALGWNVTNTDTGAFAWNGDINSSYNSKNVGTFCINPIGGIDGFYIGNQKLSDIINTAIQNALNNINS